MLSAGGRKVRQDQPCPQGTLAGDGQEIDPGPPLALPGKSRYSATGRIDLREGFGEITENALPG